MSSTNGNHQVEATIERVAGENSRQSRFKPDKNHWPSWVLYNVAEMVASAEVEAPAYRADSRERDRWLRKFARSESFLEGIVNNVIQIDANRGWALTGGRNQVLRFSQVFHNAEDGLGWRYYCKRIAEDFYQADIGGISEVGTRPGGQALAALWNVDAALAQMTGNRRKPLRFEDQVWGPDDFFRVVSKPSSEQAMNGVGRCAVSRALELSKVMLGIMQHSQEKLAARMAKGILSLFPIGEDTWQKVEAEADAELDNRERRAFGGVRVLTSEDEAIQVALTSLSQLPDGFDLSQWVEVLMSGYALVFGYDVSEFYSPRSSGFSRGAESEVQAAKATGKGEKEFSLGFQDQISQYLPDTLDFMFQERDERAEKVIAEIHEKVAKIVETLTVEVLDEDDMPSVKQRAFGDEDDEEGENPQQPAVQPSNKKPVLSRQELRSLLAMRGVIPAEWTEVIEDVTSTDTREERQRLRDSYFVHRTAQEFPHEPIVRLHWPTGKMETFWTRAEDAVRRASFPGVTVQRETLFEDDGVVITEADVDAAITEFPEGDIRDLLEAEAQDVD